MQLEKWPNWESWVLFVDLEWSAVPVGPGTYMIAARHQLHRAVGIDHEGILDIGTSKRRKRPTEPSVATC